MVYDQKGWQRCRRPASSQVSRRVLLGGGAGVAAASMTGLYRPARVSAQPGAGNDGAAIREQVQRAHDAGRSSVRLRPGVYHLAPPGSGESYSLRLLDLSDLSIDAYGVTLVLTDSTAGGVEFAGCRNVSLRGATITTAVPPTTQGIVTEVSERSYVFAVERGYPDLGDLARFPANPTSYVFDAATLEFKRGSDDMYSSAVTRLDDGRYRVEMDYPINQIEPGDLVAFRGIFAMMLRSTGCTGMLFEDVTVLNSNGFALFEASATEAGANRYVRVRVGRGAAPDGAINPPLLGCTADGFKSVAQRTGPTVEDCLFEHMADDGFSAHGNMTMVAVAPRSTTALITRINGEQPFVQGDTVHVIDQSGLVKGFAMIQEVTAVGRPANGCELPAPYNAFTEFLQLRLDRDLGLECGDFLYNDSLDGDDYVIRGTTIRNHRARGMLLKADRGLVEGNRVERSSIAGIAIGPEPTGFAISGNPRDVVVRNNTIIDTGYIRSRDARWGGITVHMDQFFDAAEAVGSRRIVIEDNTIRDVSGVSMYLDGIGDSKVRGNRFIRPNQRPGVPDGTSPDTNCVVLIDRAEVPVHFTRNSVTEVGAANTGGLVRRSERSGGVVGLPGGIRETS